MRFLWKNVNSQKKVVCISPLKKKRRKKKNVGHRIAGTFINLYSMETSKPFYLGQPIEIHRNEIKGSPYGALLSIFKVHVHEIFSHILAENSSGNSSSNLFHKEITRKISSIPRKILILLPRTKFHAFPCSTRFNCRDSSFIRTTVRILNSNDPINRRCSNDGNRTHPFFEGVKRFPPTTPAPLCTALPLVYCTLNRTGNYTYACSRYVHHTLIHLT